MSHLGHEMARRTIAQILERHGLDPAPERNRKTTWKELLSRHGGQIVATDFFPVVDHPTEGRIRSMRPSARWSETPEETSRLAPRLSEHSAEILQEAGFAPDEIAAMVRDGVTKAVSNT